MEKQDNKYTHVVVKDDYGTDYLCPAKSVKGTNNEELDFNVCFERNVPGRYAARLNIRKFQ